MFQELYQRIRIECPLRAVDLPEGSSLGEAEFSITPG